MRPLKIILSIVLLAVILFVVYFFYNKKRNQDIENKQFTEVQKLNKILIQDIPIHLNLNIRTFGDLDDRLGRYLPYLEPNHYTEIKNILDNGIISEVDGELSKGILYKCSRKKTGLNLTSYRVVSYLYYKGQLNQSEVYYDWLEINKKEEIKKIGKGWHKIVYIEEARGF